MAIEVASSFDMKSQLPIDGRYVVEDLTARDAIDSGVRHEGMQVYVKSEQKVYFLKGGITNDDWQEMGSGAGGSGEGSLNYIENGNAEADEAAPFISYGDGASYPVSWGESSPGIGDEVIRDTTNVIRGAASWSTSSTGLGNGYKYDFTVDEADLGAVLSIDILYRYLAPGADGDWAIWVYDVDNSAPVKVYGGVAPTANANGSELLATENIASVSFSFTATDSLNYRLLIHNCAPSAELNFEVRIGPKASAGGAGSGGINLESSPYAQDGLNGWALFDDGATATGVDFTGGTAAATFTADADSEAILNGEFKGAYKLSYTAADHQGEGVAKAYSIPKFLRDKGYVLVSSLYSASAAIATGDMILAAYDVTNSELITISANEVPGVSANGTGKISAIIPISSDTASLRVGFMRAVTTATAFDFAYSDFRIGPPNQLVVPPTVKYLGALTTTGSWTTNTTYTGKYWRNADRLRGQVFIALTGAPDSATLTISLPNGLSVNTDRLTIVSSVATDVTVSGMYLDNGTGNGDVKVFLDTSDKTKLHIRAQNDASGESNLYGAINQASPITWASSDSILVTYEVPIEGWDNSSNIVDAAEFGIKTAKVLLTSDDQPSVGTSATKITFNNVVKDELGLYSSGKFTAPSRMAVDIMGLLTTDSETWAAGNAVAVRAYVNGSQRHIIGIKRFETAATQGADVPISATIDLEKGDELEIYASSSVATNILNSATSNLLSIQARPDLTAIAAIAGQEVYKTASLASGSATSLTSFTSKTIVSLELPPGDWFVWGHVGYHDSAETKVKRLSQGISTSPNEITVEPFTFAFDNSGAYINTSGGGTIYYPANPKRFLLTETTTIYMSSRALFPSGTLSAFGTIKAKGRLRA